MDEAGASQLRMLNGSRAPQKHRGFTPCRTVGTVPRTVTTFRKGTWAAMMGTRSPLAQTFLEHPLCLVKANSVCTGWSLHSKGKAQLGLGRPGGSEVLSRGFDPPSPTFLFLPPSSGRLVPHLALPLQTLPGNRCLLPGQPRETLSHGGPSLVLGALSPPYAPDSSANALAPCLSLPGSYWPASLFLSAVKYVYPKMYHFNHV